MAPTQGTSSARPPSAESVGYTVVARRYRPQRFEDVVGQDHVVQALRNAIRLNRVTHAYLFAGTRGVGKTSIARIFAKCLNCVKGPTEEPCLTCDICQAIAVGQDVDVIEIDGASNNGVEAVRELRQNASLRPSRARFKIYYIDEVHMLSTGAFNALLKTLEEPPEHVKFFFATTEANKIPITVLSRCQRYDFAGISPEQVVESLAEICALEHIEAEAEALRIVARRSGGSMRDAQSLLEQLLSSGVDRLTAELVHRMLGTASDERLLDLVEALADRDPAGALGQLDQAASKGVQPVDLLAGLVDFLRDAMILAAGAEGSLLVATPRQRPRLQSVVDRWSLDGILAALQILSETRGRLRGSPYGRLLVEMALVRMARLSHLGDMTDFVQRLTALESGEEPASRPSRPPSPVKKKSEPAKDSSAPPPPSHSATGAASPVERSPLPSKAIDLDAVLRIWPELFPRVGVRIAMALSQVQPTAIAGPNIVVIALDTRYNWVADECEAREPRRKIEQALMQLLGHPMTLRFQRSNEEPTPPTPDATSARAIPSSQAPLEDDPMVKKVVELFEARPVHVEVEGNSA